MARLDGQGCSGADRLTRPPPLSTRVLRDSDPTPPTPKGESESESVLENRFGIMES